MKETHAFALFPGGFGTHDEAFEALTLLQTGKSSLMPVVFVDAPDSTYWHDWYDFIRRHMLPPGFISRVICICSKSHVTSMRQWRKYHLLPQLPFVSLRQRPIAHPPATAAFHRHARLPES